MGDFGTGAAGKVLSTIAGLTGLFSGKIDKNVKRALDGLRLTMAVAFEAVAGFMSETGQKQSKGLGLLRRLWDGVLIPFLLKVDSWVKKAHGWLDKTLGPILRTLIKWRKKLLDFYRHWFRPIFDTIDVVRHMLRLLAFLHVEVAGKIERKLGAFEDWVNAKFAYVEGKVNELIDTTELVIDGFGFYQKYTWIRSQVLYARETWNVLLHRQLEGVDQVDAAAMKQRKVQPIEARTLADQVNEYRTTGAGELAPDVDVYLEQWRTSADHV
jgi:hypothetical protein